MRILYLDCFSGISGNMALGAFLDLGVEENTLIEGLKKLNVDGYEIKISKKAKNGIMGTYVDIILEDGHEDHHHGHSHDHDEQHEHDHHHDHYHSHDRNLFDIEKLIDDSDLENEVKDLSKRIFKYVALAESKIHGKPLSEVHFHEVGAIDSIMDIVGTAICINELKVDKVVSSPLHTGTGFVKCQHGLIPVPVPATLEILKEEKIPFYSTGIPRELVTPTGAAIIAGIVDEFGVMPDMEAEAVGYGAGTRDLEIPNMLRMIVGVKKNRNLRYL